jgi:hypothetical protein
MFVKAGIVTKTVSKITLTAFFFLMKSNLKIREIRIALMKVVEAPNSKLDKKVIIVEAIVVRTIKKSNKFPESLKYPL